MPFSDSPGYKKILLILGFLAALISNLRAEFLENEAIRTPTSVATVLAYDYFYLDRRPILSKIDVPTLLIMT